MPSTKNVNVEVIDTLASLRMGINHYAKALPRNAFLLGSAGPDWLDARGLHGRFVALDGAVSENRSWSEAAR